MFTFYECFDHHKMAESVHSELLNNVLSDSDNVSNIECAVCLQSSIHPAELPCGHIFCYLCIKGIVNQGRRCAMCRQDIPVDYLNKPRLLKPMDANIASQGFEDGHLWFYEGHNGWWQYDERTSLELESAYQKGERSCDLLIAGFLYVADFNGMVQYRKNDPSRRRRIKRDLATTSKKGIAGLKASISTPSEVISNERIETLPVSNSSALNNLSGIRIFSSATNNHSQIIEQRAETSPRLSESSNRYSASSCRPAISTNLNATSSPDSSVSYSRNLNLDNVIHNTLDWTIEQIESLNLELLNDYEALFRDVNSYGQLQDNLNQSRYRTSNNYMSRYLNISNPLSESVENDVDSTHTVSNLSNFINGVLSNSSPGSLENTNHSDLDEIPLSRSPLGSSVSSPPPLPPPRNRGMSRARMRQNSSQNISNSNNETLLQKFLSKK